MSNDQLAFTYIGGPTALLEWGGLRLLTDPTFDPAGTEYPTGAYTLRKTAGPAVRPESLGRIDAVLLSHDQHVDNLDYAGHVFLRRAGMALTTPAGAKRFGDHVVGLVPWQTVDLPTQQGHKLRVTGTPARHGPPGGDRGPVTGFVLAPAESPNSAVYISGDTVWYEGVAEVSRRCSIQIAILFMGAAHIWIATIASFMHTANHLYDTLVASTPAVFAGWLAQTIVLLILAVSLLVVAIKCSVGTRAPRAAIGF